MNNEEYDFLEQMALDNYMADKIVDDIFELLKPIPFNELPTLGDFLGE